MNPTPPVKRPVGRPKKKALTGWERIRVREKAAKVAAVKAEQKEFEQDLKESARELGVKDVPTVLKWGTPEQCRQAGAMGTPAARAQKPWREALDRAIIQSDPKVLRLLAEALIKQAKRGDVSALKEIGDRLDGKSIQQVEAKVQAIVHVTSDDAKL